MPIPDGWENPPTAGEVAARGNGAGATHGIRCVECGAVGVWRVFWVRHGDNCRRRVLKCIQCGHKQATKEVPL